MTTIQREWLAAYGDSIVISFLVTLFSILYYALFALLIYKPNINLTDQVHRFLVPEYIDVMAENLFYLLFSYRNILVILSVPFFISAAIKARSGSAAHRLQWLGFLGLYIYQFAYSTFFYVSPYPPYLSLLSIISIGIVVISLASFVRKYRTEVRRVEFGFSPSVPHRWTVAYLIYKIAGISVILLISIPGIMGVGDLYSDSVPIALFFFGTIAVFVATLGVYIWVIVQVTRNRDHGCALAVIVLTNDKIPDFPTLALIFLIIPFFILYLVPAYLSKRFVTDIGRDTLIGSRQDS